MDNVFEIASKVKQRDFIALSKGYHSNSLNDIWINIHFYALIYYGLTIPLIYLLPFLSILLLQLNSKNTHTSVT